MGIRFDFLPAGGGDCIFIQTDLSVLLIDTGRAGQSRVIHNKISEQLNERKANKKSFLINHIILTHTDDDHIGGMRRLINDTSFMSNVECIWFNYPNDESVVFQEQSTSNNNSYNKADKLRKLIQESKVKHKTTIDTTTYIMPYALTSDTTIDLLSPTLEKRLSFEKCYNEELTKNYQNSHHTSVVDNENIDAMANLSFPPDKKIPNGSSIAFILYYSDKSFLLLADAHPDTIILSLAKKNYSIHNPIKVDMVKISHHGSRSNTNNELLALVRADHFIISAAEGEHPHKDLIAKILVFAQAKTTDVYPCIHFTEEKVYYKYLKEPIFSDYKNRFHYTTYLVF